MSPPVACLIASGAEANLDRTYRLPRLVESHASDLVRRVFEQDHDRRDLSVTEVLRKKDRRDLFVMAALRKKDHRDFFEVEEARQMNGHCDLF